jgi:RNA polymerase sigma-70 factor (ECF subfamily)
MSQQELQERHLRFESLAMPYMDDLQRFVQAMTRDEEQTKDVIGETLYRAYKSFEQIRELNAVKSWLFTIARNEFYNLLRKRNDVEVLDDDAEDQFADANPLPDAAMDAVLLREALAFLPAKQREALLLFEVFGFSLLEIQAVQEDSLSAVKQRLKRGREKLAQALGMADSLVKTAQTSNNYALRAHVHNILRNIPAAVDDYEESLAIEPNARMFFLRASLLVESNRENEAWNDLNSALAITPNDAEALFLRGVAAYNMKRPDEACNDWSLAARQGHRQANALLEAKCKTRATKYRYKNAVETATETRQREYQNLTTIIGVIESRLILARHAKDLGPVFQLDSLSHTRYGNFCTVENIADKNLPIRCAVHLLYAVASEQKNGALLASVKNFHNSLINYEPPTTNKMKVCEPDPDRRLDHTQYNETITRAVANGASAEQIR